MKNKSKKNRIVADPAILMARGGNECASLRLLLVGDSIGLRATIDGVDYTTDHVFHAAHFLEPTVLDDRAILIQECEHVGFGILNEDNRYLHFQTWRGCPGKSEKKPVAIVSLPHWLFALALNIGATAVRGFLPVEDVREQTQTIGRNTNHDPTALSTTSA